MEEADSLIQAAIFDLNNLAAPWDKVITPEVIKAAREFEEAAQRYYQRQNLKGFRWAISKWKKVFVDALSKTRSHSFPDHASSPAPAPVQKQQGLW